MADWIVVVDDDTATLKVAGLILSKAGMRVTAFSSGRLALDYIRKNSFPDLIGGKIRHASTDVCTDSRFQYQNLIKQALPDLHFFILRIQPLYTILRSSG